MHYQHLTGSSIKRIIGIFRTKQTTDLHWHLLPFEQYGSSGYQVIRYLQFVIGVGVSIIHRF